MQSPKKKKSATLQHTVVIQTTRHGFWGNGTAAATSGSAGKVTNGPTQSNSPSVRSTRVVHDFPPNVHNAWNSTFLCCTPSHISPPPKCDVEMHLPSRRGATNFAVGHGRRHVGRVFLYCGAPAAVCAACHTFGDINSLCTFPSQTTATTTTSWGQFYSHTKKSSSVWIARRLASMRNKKNASITLLHGKLSRPIPSHRPIWESHTEAPGHKDSLKLPSNVHLGASWW